MDNGRKRKREAVDVVIGKRQNGADTMINDMPDEFLISILSRLSLKEAERSSVLSRRWRYLWRFTSGSLDFDYWGRSYDGSGDRRHRFKEWVDRVLLMHQAPRIDSFIVSFDLLYPAPFFDKWMLHAMKKEPRNLEIKSSHLPAFRHGYEFPNVHKLSPDSYGLKSAFGSLESLKLAYVDIQDEMVHYFLASCTSLECLSICASSSTRNLEFVDPLPNFKHLEIFCRYNIKSLKISVASLVSFTYVGTMFDLSIKNVPKVSEVAVTGNSCELFLFEPDKHLSYSFHLERLKLGIHARFLEVPQRDFAYYQALDFTQWYSLKRLEVKTKVVVGRSLLFFTKLIKSCPILHEFRIEMGDMEQSILFPKVNAAEAPLFHHENLKSVELAGYIVCSSDEEFVTQILKIVPSLDMVTIDTHGCDFGMLEYLHSKMKKVRMCEEEIPEYTHAKSEIEAKEFAERLRLKFLKNPVGYNMIGG